MTVAEGALRQSMDEEETAIPLGRPSGHHDRRLSHQHDRHSISSIRSVSKATGFRANVGLENIGRRALGIFLLLVTVCLWTTSNFLASVGYPL